MSEELNIWASMDEALKHINSQPDPVRCARKIASECIEHGEYEFASELLAYLKEPREYEVEITRQVVQPLTRTVVALGPSSLARSHVYHNWLVKADHMVFGGCEKAAKYIVGVNERI